VLLLTLPPPPPSFPLLLPSSLLFPQWYEATIDQLDDGDEMYMVTFEGYGNQELVSLGEIQIPASLKESRGRER